MLKTTKTGLCPQCMKIGKRKVKRPPYKQLLNEIEELGYSGTGRKYCVSNSAIKDWIRMYEKYGESF